MKQMQRVADEKEQMQRVDVVSASYMASWVTGWWVVSSMGLEKLVYDTARSCLALTLPVWDPTATLAFPSPFTPRRKICNTPINSKSR